jgi:hypothetical protein
MESRSEYLVLNVNDTSYDADWDVLQKRCKYLSDWGKICLSSLLKGTVKSIVIEPNYICKDHRNLYSNFYSKRFGESSPLTNRLHFFLTNIDKKELLFNPDKYQPSYIGYSVIRPVAQRCIGRTIIDPKKLKILNRTKFYCLSTPFSSHIGGNRFSVNGYPYVSQDADVTVCAHSVLWGICRYLSERYRVYQELYPFDLINLTEQTLGRQFPYRGLSYADYSKILSMFGAYPALVWLKENASSPQKPEKYKDMCTYIESGFPLVASFYCHAVSIIGHTIDYSSLYTADANGFIDSSSFWKQLIVVDDNCHPYMLLGKENDPDNYGKIYMPNHAINLENIGIAVCPLPEKVFLPADKARERAIKLLTKLMAEFQKTGNPPYVTRLFLTTNTSFKRRLLQRAVIPGKIDQLSSYVAEINLPHFIWVLEVGPLDLYKQGLCTFELVLDSTVGELEDSFLYVRIGNKLTTYDNISNVGGQMSFKQYTHNLGE